MSLLDRFIDGCSVTCDSALIYFTAVAFRICRYIPSYINKYLTLTIARGSARLNLKSNKKINFENYTNKCNRLP